MTPLGKQFAWSVLRWLIVSLLLLFVAIRYGRSEDAKPTITPAPSSPTVIVLERVVPRGCLKSVQLKDPDKCHIAEITLAPGAECRGPVGEQLSCSGFVVKLSDEPACHYIVTKLTDCENVNVKKVPANTNPSGDPK